MLRAAKLHPDVYEEVEHDREATSQAAIVVVAGSLAVGIGTALSGGGDFIVQAIALVIFSLIGWALYAWITYFIGTRFLAVPETSADWGELARTLGFANAPRILMVFAIGPVLGGIVGLIVGIWVLVTTIVALKAALEFTTGRAIATAILGWIVQGLVLGIALSLFL
jgi:hypothetical protein